MEHMDRKKRSLVVQFYLTVEGLKDPLEEEHRLDEPFQHAGDQSTVESVAVQALADDVQLLLTTYLLTRAVPVDQSLTETLSTFHDSLRGADTAVMTMPMYRRIRHTIFAAQAQVLEEMMETDWPTFIRSDLFVKAMADMPGRTIYSGAARTKEDSCTLSQPAIPSSASSSSKSSASLKRSRAQAMTSSSTACIAVDKKPPFIRAASEREEPLKSHPLDFLTGSASIPQVKKERPPLFMEEVPLLGSPNGGMTEQVDELEQQKTMEAIQEALSSILAGNTSGRQSSEKSSIHSQASLKTPSSNFPPEQATRAKTSNSAVVPPLPVRSGRPLLHSRTISVAGEGNSIDDTSEHELFEKDYESDDGSTSTRQATLGNVDMPVESEHTTARIEKLQYQGEVLIALLKKAELIGNGDEAKILQKSIDALQREIGELAFQKRQLEVQVADNTLLPGLTTVRVIGTTIGQSHGKEFALYLVEVNQLAEDMKTQTAGWLVTRRFSEFVALHSVLKGSLPAVRSLDLPNKRLVTSLSGSVLQQRRSSLEKYLQALIEIPGAISNRDVRAFLSQQNISLRDKVHGAATLSTSNENTSTSGLLRSLFRTVTTGMDEIFGGPSMLDAIIFRLSQQAADFAEGAGDSSGQNEDLISSRLDGAVSNEAPVDLLNLSSGLQPVEGEGLTYFTAPIANILVEIFDLKDKGSWLRRQAIIIILQQVLGGTIERSVSLIFSLRLLFKLAFR